MARILDPAQIESFGGRSIPRIRLPDRATLFANRAQRLRELSEPHTIGDYLRLMAVLVDAQQTALAALPAANKLSSSRIEQARAHRMPLIHAIGSVRETNWHAMLLSLCESVAASPNIPAAARELCSRLSRLPAQPIEEQAEALLAARTETVDAAAAPFVMAALQVCWVDQSSRLAVEDVAELEMPGLCPVCGTLPVSSIVRNDSRSPGLRYLHCALCATEWHMVRVTCSHCQSTEGITYHSIEGGSGAVRAESCSACGTYRKILYQEKDTGVEPVADDLASLALDLLMSEEGYHRGSANPLLWQSP